MFPCRHTNAHYPLNKSHFGSFYFSLSQTGKGGKKVDFDLKVDFSLMFIFSLSKSTYRNFLL